MYFKDNKHKETYEKLLKRYDPVWDVSVKSLLYIISSTDDLRPRCTKFLDENKTFQTDKVAEFYEVLSTSAQHMIRLGADLFSGSRAISYNKAPWKAKEFSVFNIFSYLDEENVRVCLQAIQISFLR